MASEEPLPAVPEGPGDAGALWDPKSSGSWLLFWSQTRMSAAEEEEEGPSSVSSACDGAASVPEHKTS